MLSHQLISYVATQLQRFKEGDVESALRTSGWQPQDVREALTYVKNQYRRMVFLKATAIACVVFMLASIAAAVASPRLFSKDDKLGLQKSRLLGSAGSGPSYYVATTGNDSDDGSLAHPFATLEKAKSVARGQVGVTVYVRSGTYQLDAALGFDSQDSGSSESPNIWRNYPGEYPVITGSKKITLDPGLSGTVSIPISQFGLDPGTAVHAVYLNGSSQNLARTPNATTPNYSQVDPWVNFFAQVAADTDKRLLTYDPAEVSGALLSDPSTWATPSNGRVHIYSGAVYWPNIVNISSVDSGNHQIVLASDTSYNMVQTQFHNRYYVENLPELLDAPGEWYQGAAGANVQFVLPGTTTGTETLSAVWMSNPLQLSGASYLEFHNLSLEEFGYGPSPQNGGYIVKLNDSHHITLDGLVISDAEGLGVYSLGTTHDVTIRNSRLTNLKNSAIQLGPETGYSNFKTFTSSGILVENNYISHIGFGAPTSSPGIRANNYGTIIRNNLIHDLAAQGILADRGHGGLVIEANRVYDVNRLIRDSSAIYLIPFSDNVLPSGNVRSFLPGGNTIRGNFVSDTGGYDYDTDISGMRLGMATWGIYLDDYESNTLVENNIVARSYAECFLIHTGSDNTVRNNICYAPKNKYGQFRLHEDLATTEVYDSMYNEVQNLPTETKNLFFSHYPSLALLSATQVRGDIMVRNNFNHNIAYVEPTSSPNLYFHYWLGDNNQIDNNLFYMAGSVTPVTGGNFADNSWIYTWAAWQSHGFDLNSQFANPLFSDAANDNFWLAEGSPALSMGFQQIDQTAIGLRGVSPQVVSPGTNASSYTVGDAMQVTWQAPAGNGYRTYSSQLRTESGSTVTAWADTTDLSATISTSAIDPGTYKACVKAKTDTRIPNTGVASDWGEPVCTSTVTIAAVVANGTPTPTPSTPTPSSTTSTKKKKTSSTASPSTAVSPTPSATPSESSEATPTPTVSASPSASITASPTVTSSVESTGSPTPFPWDETSSGSSGGTAARVGFSLLAVVCAVGAAFATTTMLSTRHLLGLP